IRKERAQRRHRLAFACVKPYTGVAAIVALLVASCSSHSAKVVDYDWSRGAAQVMATAAAAATASCMQRLTTNTVAPSQGPLGTFESETRARDECASATPTPKQYDAEVQKARASALAKVCRATAADKVRVTSLDFAGNRL